MKRILILEDNPIAMNHLRAIIKKINIKCRIYGVTNIIEANDCMLAKDIDLFLVDIILDTSRPGDTSGLSFIQNVRKIEKYLFAPVICITSLQDPKLFVYEELHCYRFVEKPFDDESVRENVEKCLRFPRENTERKILFFRKDGIIVAVGREEIVYVESNNHALILHTRDRGILQIPYITIGKFLIQCDSDKFIQCSRNSVINRQYLKNVDFTNRIIELKDNFGRVNIGIMYKKILKENLK